MEKLEKLSLDNSLFSYEALQRQANLVAHSEGKAIDREVFICPQFLEIEADGAVVPAGERDVLAINHENSETVEEAERFNASGNQINKSHRGLNIIRMSDGTVKKVVVK